MWIFPLFGFKTQFISLKIVLFPAPFCHIIVIFNHFLTEKLTSSKIGFVNIKSNDTSSNLITVSKEAIIFLKLLN